jgi:hypothetical protein
MTADPSRDWSSSFGVIRDAPRPGDELAVALAHLSQVST